MHIYLYHLSKSFGHRPGTVRIADAPVRPAAGDGVAQLTCQCLRDELETSVMYMMYHQVAGPGRCDRMDSRAGSTPWVSHSTLFRLLLRIALLSIIAFQTCERYE